MANLKISQLPSYTDPTNPDIWFVNNDSGETVTTKIQLNQIGGLLPGSAANSIKSADWLVASPNTVISPSSIVIGGANIDTSINDNNIILGNSNNTAEAADKSIFIGRNQANGAFNSIQIGKDHSSASPNVIAIGGTNISYASEERGTYLNAHDSGINSTGLNNAIYNASGVTISDPVANAIVVGVNDVTPSYSNTTYVDGLQIKSNNGANVLVATGTTPVMDMNLSSFYRLEMTDDVVTWDMNNMRDGGRYRVVIRNMSGSDWTFQFPPTMPGLSPWYDTTFVNTAYNALSRMIFFDVHGTDVFITFSTDLSD